MKMKNIARRVGQILFAILLVASIVIFSLSMAVSHMFSVNRVNARLFQNGFYDRATQTFTEQIESLQSVIGVTPEAVTAIVTPMKLQEMLAPYTDALTKQRLAGGPAPKDTEYFSEELYDLVCDVITEDHYDGDITQLTSDRVDAYNELTGAVNHTVNFFPQSIVNKVLGGEGQQKLTPLYQGVGILRQLWLPAIAVFILSAVGMWLLRSRDSLSALRGIIGTWFITASVLFVPTAFIHSYSLPQRLSLADGLLRRYILTLYSHMTDSLLSITLLIFVVSAVLLVISVILSAKYAPKGCNDRSNVLK